MWWLKERVHETWHLTAVCYGFLVGVVLANFWSLPIWISSIVAVFGIGLGFWKRRRILVGVVFVAAVCLGMARGTVGLMALDRYGSLIGEQISLTGRVLEDVDQGRGGMFGLRLGDVEVDGRYYEGQVWASVAAGAEQVRRSDTVTVRGFTKEGFGNFAISLSNVTIVDLHRPVPGDVALEVRDSFAEDVRQTVSEPGASLGLGFLVGQKSALPSDLLESLRIAGLTHIVVASGYNLTILVRLGRRLFARISKFLATFVSGLMIAGFMTITGLSPSMSRAGLVSGLSLWAWYYGRKFHPATLLGIAAAVTVALNPSFIWGDVGWMLSFAAFAGVMIIGPIISAYFFGDEKPPFMVQILFETIAATVATIPIIAVVFGQFSNVALLANLLILPIIPFTMFFTALAGIGGMVSLDFLGWFADKILAVMIVVIDWCAGFSWASRDVEWGWLTVGLYTIGLVGLTYYMKRQARFSLRTASIVE